MSSQAQVPVESNQDIPSNPFKKNRRFGGVQKSPTPVSQFAGIPKPQIPQPQQSIQQLSNLKEHNKLHQQPQQTQQQNSQAVQQPQQPTRCNSSLIIMNFTQDNSIMNFGASENSIAITPLATPRQQSFHQQANQQMQKTLRLNEAEQLYIKQQQLFMNLNNEKFKQSIYNNGNGSQYRPSASQYQNSMENFSLKESLIDNAYKQKIQNLIQNNDEESSQGNTSQALENLMVHLESFPDDNMCNHEDHYEEKIVMPQHIDFSKKSQEEQLSTIGYKEEVISALPLENLQERMKQNQKNNKEEYAYSVKKSGRSGSSDLLHSISQPSNASLTFFSPRISKNAPKQGELSNTISSNNDCSYQVAQKQFNIPSAPQQQSVNINSINALYPAKLNSSSSNQTIKSNQQIYKAETQQQQQQQQNQQQPQIIRNSSPHSQSVTQNPFLKIQIANGINTLERQENLKHIPQYKNINLNQLGSKNINDSSNFNNSSNKQLGMIGIASNNYNIPLNATVFTSNQFSNGINPLDSKDKQIKQDNLSQIPLAHVNVNTHSHANLHDGKSPLNSPHSSSSLMQQSSLPYNQQFQQQDPSKMSMPSFQIAPKITLSRQVSANSINKPTNIINDNHQNIAISSPTYQNMSNSNSPFAKTQNIQQNNQSNTNIKNIPVVQQNGISLISHNQQNQNVNINLSQFNSTPSTKIDLNQNKQPIIQKAHLPKEPKTDKNIYSSSKIDSQNDFQDAVESVKRSANERGKSEHRKVENQNEQFVPLSGVEFPVLKFNDNSKVDEQYLKSIISPETLKILEEHKEIKKEIAKYRGIDSSPPKKSEQKENDMEVCQQQQKVETPQTLTQTRPTQLQIVNPQIVPQSQQPQPPQLNPAQSNGMNQIPNQLTLANQKQQLTASQQYNHQNIQDVFNSVQQNYQNLPVLLNQQSFHKQIPQKVEPPVNAISLIQNRQKATSNHVPTNSHNQKKPQQQQQQQQQQPAPVVGLNLLSVRHQIPEAPIQGVTLLNQPYSNSSIIQKMQEKPQTNNANINYVNEKEKSPSDRSRSKTIQQENNEINVFISPSRDNGFMSQSYKQVDNLKIQKPLIAPVPIILDQNVQQVREIPYQALNHIEFQQVPSKTAQSPTTSISSVPFQHTSFLNIQLDLNDQNVQQIRSLNFGNKEDKQEIKQEPMKQSPQNQHILQHKENPLKVLQNSPPKMINYQDLIQNTQTETVSINQPIIPSTKQPQQSQHPRDIYSYQTNSINYLSVPNELKEITNCHEIESHFNYSNSKFANNKTTLTPEKITTEESQTLRDDKIMESNLSEFESVKKATPQKGGSTLSYSPCFNKEKMDTQQSPKPIIKMSPNPHQTVLQSFGFHPTANQGTPQKVMTINPNFENSKEKAFQIQPQQSSVENKLVSSPADYQLQSDIYNSNIQNSGQYYVHSNFTTNNYISAVTPILQNGPIQQSFDISELTNISDTKNIILPQTEQIKRANFTNFSKSQSTNDINPTDQTHEALNKRNQKQLEVQNFDIQQHLTTESIEVDFQPDTNPHIIYAQRQDLTPTLKRNGTSGQSTTTNSSALKQSNKIQGSSLATSDRKQRTNQYQKNTISQTNKQKNVLGHRGSRQEDILNEQINELQKQTKKMIEKSQQKVKSYSQERFSNQVKQIKYDSKSPQNFEKQSSKVLSGFSNAVSSSSTIGKGSSSCRNQGNQSKDQQNLIPKAEINMKKGGEQNRGTTNSLQRNSSQDISPVYANSTYTRPQIQESVSSLQNSFNIKLSQNMIGSLNNIQDKNTSSFSHQNQINEGKMSGIYKSSKGLYAPSNQNSMSSNCSYNTNISKILAKNNLIDTTNNQNTSRTQQNTSRLNVMANSSSFSNQQSVSSANNITSKLAVTTTIETERLSKQNDYPAQQQQYYIDLQNYNSTPNSSSNQNNHNHNTNNQHTNYARNGELYQSSFIKSNNNNNNNSNNTEKSKLACQWQTRTQIKNLLKMKQDSFFSQQNSTKNQGMNDKKMNFKQ